MFLYLSENDAFTPKTNNGSHTSPKEKNFINNAVEIFDSGFHDEISNILRYEYYVWYFCKKLLYFAL